VQRFRCLSPDIVHFNQSNPYSQQYSVIAARCAGARNLVAIYHLTPGQPTRSRRGRCLERFIMLLLRRVLVLSRQNGEEMCAAFPASRGKIEIVQNGLEDPGRPDARVARQLRERLGLGAGKIIIAAAGRLTPQKGFETLLDAAALLERRDIAVVIAGEGPLRRTLEEEARRRGLNGTIVFPGFLEGAGTLFGASDLVAIPSLYEGQPFVLLEAMAAGKAVVASDMYGIREAVVQGETGMLVRPGSAEELARALSRLIDDPALRRAMGERARRRYEEHYTAREFRERMERIYTSLAEGAR
jgi:glycosyltransferase involved in cell wall biosynthesis